MNEIFHELPILCNAERLYEAITDESYLSKWWLAGAKYEAVIGALGLFPFSDGSGNIAMRVDDIEPGRKQVWSCTQHKHGEWINTKISFELIPESEKSCVLRFKHSNWANTDGVYGRVSFYWAALYLRNLKLMLEKEATKP